MRLIYIIFFFLISLISRVLLAQSNEWLTFYEKSGFIETPRYQETIEYSKKLADHSPLITYHSFGSSPQGRDLPLLILSKSGITSVEEIDHNDKAIVLIQACIHAGESDGKDAGLMLLRDIVIHKINLELLENIVILFVPIFNVDGHERFGPYNRINQNGPSEMGWRATAQQLNLNRDYLKADTPEMQAMINLYQSWMPDFYIDCHVTDGADYIYPLTYGLQMHGNLSQGQSDWIKSKYLPFVESNMKSSGNPIAPYMDFVQWHNPKNGIKAYMETPRYSGGYAAINNRPALLIETHMLKNYRTRVTATYNMLLYSLQFIASQSDQLKHNNLKADEETKYMSANNTKYILTYATEKANEVFNYEGYKYTIEKSSLSGGDWYQYSNDPETFSIDYYSWIPKLSVEVPYAYIIPVEFTAIINKLKLHNVKMTGIDNDTTVLVETFQLENVTWKPKPFEGRIMLDYEVKPIIKKMIFLKGSLIIDMNQRAAQVIMHLLEPMAPDALVRWGFFNSIFEQKEYAESYVIEKIAREMIDQNPELLIELEELKNNDATFASNPYAVWNWFYQKSPYWDSNIGIYPIGRIMKK